MVNLEWLKKFSKCENCLTRKQKDEPSLGLVFQKNPKLPRQIWWMIGLCVAGGVPIISVKRAKLISSDLPSWISQGWTQWNEAYISMTNMTRTSIIYVLPDHKPLIASPKYQYDYNHREDDDENSSEYSGHKNSVITWYTAKQSL